MEKIKSLLIGTLASLAFYGCSDEAIISEAPLEVGLTSEPYSITVALNSDVESRMGYNASNGMMYTTWSSGDALTVTNTPNYISGGTSYTFSLNEADAGKSVGTFTCNDFTNGESTTSNNWVVYYPSTITNDSGFYGFSYEGQEQDGNNSTTHLTKYHAIRYATGTSQTGKDFVDNIVLYDSEKVEQSSCLKFDLTFDSELTPTKIVFRIIANGFPRLLFSPKGNSINGFYSSSDVATDKLELALKNIGSTKHLEAYMMMSNKSIRLGNGVTLRIEVLTADKKYYIDKKLNKEFTFDGGKLHTLTVKEADEWKENTTLASTSYEKDGLQYPTGNSGELTLKGVTEQTNTTDIIFMGDGFIDQDFNATTDYPEGKYKYRMKEACDYFFSVEPFNSLKSYFDAYYINAVSENRPNYDPETNGAWGTGAITKFSSVLTPYSTSVSGNDNLVIEYAKQALKSSGKYTDEQVNERIQTALMVVIINQENCHAGTCGVSWQTQSINGQPVYDLDYGHGHSVAYFTVNTTPERYKYTLIHEACGHGFGKLADEYNYSDTPFNADDWNSLYENQKYGISKNVDKYWTEAYGKEYEQTSTVTSASAAVWGNMISEYGAGGAKDEGLGVYEGAFVCSKGFCRPSENSIMRHQFDTDGQYFNAASRWTIYYRLMRLTGRLKVDKDKIYSEFLEFEKNYTITKTDPNLVSATEARSFVVNQQELLPLAPPVYTTGHWENGRFIQD